MADNKKNQSKNQSSNNEKKQVNLDPNRHEGKTFAQVRQETFEGIGEIIGNNESLQKRNVSFKVESNRAGDTEYHMYEDANPNDTTPARLTAIFDQNQIDKAIQSNRNEMEEAIQSRKDDSFYSYDNSKQGSKTPVLSSDDPDVEVGGGSGSDRGGISLFCVINGVITPIDI